MEEGEIQNPDGVCSPGRSPRGSGQRSNEGADEAAFGNEDEEGEGEVNMKEIDRKKYEPILDDPSEHCFGCAAWPEEEEEGEHNEELCKQLNGVPDCPHRWREVE